MRNECIQRATDWINRLRELWGQHVYWTRFFIISTAHDLADLSPVTERLLQNPKDFAMALEPFYGASAAREFQELFTQHLLIAADLVNAAKQKDAAKVEEARKQWYENADAIACFLSALNPCWPVKAWKTMLYAHLEMTEKEATLRLQGNYPADIQTFDAIEQEAYKMADFMFCGIFKQHRGCFLP